MSALGELDRFFAAIPEEVVGLCRRLRVKGKRGWVVGGCVRDLLLGREATDWDIATDARPEEVMRFFKRVVPTGIKHGTVTVLIAGNHYEVTTLRGDGHYEDGRRPKEIVFLDEIFDDLARRDFTINAIAIDPVDRQLVDPFHGQRDLAAGVVRAVGSARERFAEDGLRVLRAARFAALLGFAIEADTLAAMGDPRSLDTLAKVSAERIHDEWLKSMRAEKPSIAFELMQKTGVLDRVCPELGATMLVVQAPPPARDPWRHTMAALDAAAPDPVLRMAVLLHEVGGAELVETILKRLKFSNEHRERVVTLVRHHQIGYRSDWSDADVRRWIRRVTRERIDDVIAVARACARGHDEPLDTELGLLAELFERAAANVDRGVALSTGDLAIGGEELMSQLGLTRGPLIGEVLRALVEIVTDDPDANEPTRLLAEAKRIVRARGAP